MSTLMTRRALTQLTGAAALGAVAPLGRAGNTAGRPYYPFPAGFRWGCATASYQVEGAVAVDGRKPSVWDTWSHVPGHTADGRSGDTACDQYHLYETDVHLLRDLGAHCYRFSVAWPRVFPDGAGQPNEKGIAFYDRLVDALLAAGIEPYCTLFHWDLPQALEDRGGWLARDTSRAFGEYAAFVARRLSDRVRRFMTTNEFVCFIDQGYGSGIKAPGKRLPAAEVNRARHNALLAHGMGVAAIRAGARRRGVEVGIAENSDICVPVIETAPHIQAAAKAMRERNAPFLTAILEGRYLECYLPEAPPFTPAEMKTIGAPLDFVGLNIYSPTYVRAADTAAGYEVLPRPASYPHMLSEWIGIGPEIAYWAPRHLGEIWKVKAVYITENGCSSDDRPAAGGRIYDTDRLMYLRNHLVHAQRATAEGWPLRGYFLWSLMDNFEWADGYTRRFGVYHVDFRTQKRTPKLTADYYREVIARNAAV